MGQDHPDGWKIKFTLQQKRYAATIFHSNPYLWSTKLGPLPGESLEKPLSVVSAPWLAPQIGEVKSFIRPHPRSKSLSSKKCMIPVHECNISRPKGLCPWIKHPKGSRGYIESLARSNPLSEEVKADMEMQLNFYRDLIEVLKDDDPYSTTSFNGIKGTDLINSNPIELFIHVKG
jgi:hypothetical protein